MRPWFEAIRTARMRLAALYVAVFTVSALVLGGAVFFSARSALEGQMVARIEAETAYLAGELRTGGLDHLLSVVRLRGRGASALDYLVQEEGGVHLAGEMPGDRALRPGWTVTDVPVTTEDGGRPERLRALATDLGDHRILVVGDDFNRIREVEAAILTAFAWTIGLAALLAMGGGLVLARAFLARVDAIARTAEAIIAGDLGRRVPVRGTNDDLDRLAGTLNRMLDRIAALMESLRQVSSDIAHDLRTPLSRLYQRLEGARLQARSVEGYARAVEGAMGEIGEILATFEALLRIAQIEGAPPESGFRTVDFGAVVETVTDAYRPDIERTGRRLDTEVAPGISLVGDQQLLAQALSNLLENALRHTPPGTRIAVRLFPRGGEACLCVSDDGPGVASGDLPRLARRFFRAERSRSTPGNGLGLSLVAAVATHHRGHLHTEDAHPGLRVKLLLPIAGQSAGDGCPVPSPKAAAGRR